jgi:putative transcriptional regulator|nr:MAG TPA: Cro/C1-type HTH DNA-binding domain protein [Caudoviricetes sp.]
MKTDFSRLFKKITSEGLTQKEFKAEAAISSGTLVKMLHNESVTTDSICKICDFFKCMPEEIMEWIPDENYEEITREKEAVQAQIAELQKKLKKM